MIIEVKKAVKNDPYVILIYKNGQNVVICGTVLHYEKELPLVRVNRSVAVLATEICNVDGHRVLLKNGNEYYFSRRCLKKYATGTD